MTIRLLTLSSLLLLAVGCNQKVEFDNYPVQTVYFPIQYPVRTLVLGEDRLDNSTDLQHAFDIGVNIGGMYENHKDWTVGYAVADELVNGYQIKDVNNVIKDGLVMPSAYYSMSPDNTVTIKSGSFKGLIRVNLTDEFFNDPLSFDVNYIIPLKITSSSCDSILRGVPIVVDPDRHRGTLDWKAGALPRDYTLFAVKFINVWHGTFFHRGKQFKGGALDQIFHSNDLEFNQTAKMVTNGFRKALYQRMGSKFGDPHSTQLTFEDDQNGIGNITIATKSGSSYTASGSGKYYKSNTEFAKEHGSWLVDPTTSKAKPHLTMVLDFTVHGLDAQEMQFKDTLVFRDNGVKYEQFTMILP